MAWREECHRYVTENMGRVVTKFQFSSLFNKALIKSMTVANIAGGFRVTGIYPVNRNALTPPSHECNDLSQETGRSFIPMFSPILRRTCTAEFTEEEIALFETRYENGYDVTEDARYNKWLSKFHPESAVRIASLQYGSTAVSSFLSYPSPPSRLPQFKPKLCGRVLTSSENLSMLVEKEKKKEEKERAKKEREEKRKRNALIKLQQGTCIHVHVHCTLGH